MTLTELYLVALTMLMGKEGKDFSYYEGDETFWKWRLYYRRN